MKAMTHLRLLARLAGMSALEGGVRFWLAHPGMVVIMLILPIFLVFALLMFLTIDASVTAASWADTLRVAPLVPAALLLFTRYIHPWLLTVGRSSNPGRVGLAVLARRDTDLHGYLHHLVTLVENSGAPHKVRAAYGAYTWTCPWILAMGIERVLDPSWASRREAARLSLRTKISKSGVNPPIGRL